MGEMKNSSEQLKNIQCNQGCMCGCIGGPENKCERDDLVAELKDIKELMKQKWDNDDSENEKTETKSDHPEKDIDKVSEKGMNSDCDHKKSISEEFVSENSQRLFGKKDSQRLFKKKTKFYTDKICQDVPIPCKYHSGNFMRKRLQRNAKTATEVDDPRIAAAEKKIPELPVSAVEKESQNEMHETEFEWQMNPKLYLSRRLRERIPEKLLDQVGSFDARKPEDIICLRNRKCSLRSSANLKKTLREERCSRFNVFPIKFSKSY